MQNQSGKQTAQAKKNFPFRFRPVSLELVYAIVEIKKAAAQANQIAGLLDVERCNAIITACDVILTGKHDEQFILPALQGGAGTSINMNVNEVIATLAEAELQTLGKQISVHPNDHVNLSQSTNDVNPTGLKIASVRLAQELIQALQLLAQALAEKAQEFKSVRKLGRTHLQDAVPTTLGEEFAAYAATTERSIARIKVVLPFFSELNLGGTAIGNCINAPEAYRTEVYTALAKITQLEVRPATNLAAQTFSQTDFLMLSQTVVLVLADISKMASDLRLLSSGPLGGFGEIKLKELQPGSSIMPGKVNPVLPEAINQTYYTVSGNTLTIEHAVEGAQLELGVMFPVIADCLLTSLKLTHDVVAKFTEECVKPLTANSEKCQEWLEKSMAYATLLTPVLGYDVVSALVKESLTQGTSLRELLLAKKLLTEAEFVRITTLT